MDYRLALHVDDAIGGGTHALTSVMKKVSEKLPIGSRSSADARAKGLFCKGLRVQIVGQNTGALTGNFEILLDGN